MCDPEYDFCPDIPLRTALEGHLRLVVHRRDGGHRPRIGRVRDLVHRGAARIAGLRAGLAVVVAERLASLREVQPAAAARNGAVQFQPAGYRFHLDPL